MDPLHYYALLYDVVDDMVNRRTPYRAAHLQMALDSFARGELFLAGALGDPPTNSLLVFRGDSPASAEAFAQADPYVLNGLVTKWRVMPWTVVIGGEG